jgi:hypothetical protein
MSLKRVTHLSEAVTKIIGRGRVPELKELTDKNFDETIEALLILQSSVHDDVLKGTRIQN